MCRIIMIPFILWTFFIGYYYVSAGILVLSGITDLLDGFIARRFNMVSALGKVLDPIADKLTVLAVTVSLCFSYDAMIVLVGIFVVKEFIMFIEGLIIIKKTGTTYSARWYGKVTTLFLYLTMFMIIIWKSMPGEVTLSLIIVSAVLVVVSLILYTIGNYKMLKKFDADKAQKVAEEEEEQQEVGKQEVSKREKVGEQENSVGDDS